MGEPSRECSKVETIYKVLMTFLNLLKLLKNLLLKLLNPSLTLAWNFCLFGAPAHLALPLIWRSYKWHCETQFEMSFWMTIWLTKVTILLALTFTNQTMTSLWRGTFLFKKNLKTNCPYNIILQVHFFLLYYYFSWDSQY